MVDASLNDIGVFCVEAGRALCPRVVQSTVYAAIAVDWLGAGSAWLPRLTSGEARGTCALFNPRDASDVTPRLRVRRDGDTWRVSGDAHYVADADRADVIVASTDAGVVAVDTTANGVEIEPLPIMGGFPVFTVRFDDVLVDEPTPVDEEQLRRTANAIVALDCLDLVGVGEAVIDRTVAYTKMREQFGRPIASFQAAQHVVADMHIALAAARLAAQSATFWIGRGKHRDARDGDRPDSRRRGQEDHPRRASTARRDGLRRRHRPAPVLRASAGAVDARRRGGHRREMA